MEFRVLGPLEVHDGERRIPIAAGKQRALLAYLLVHRDTTISTDRLVDELWPSAPPATAAKIVRNLVSELRKQLGADGVAIVTDGGGYRLHVSAEQVDASRFEALTAQGRRLLEGGEAHRAAEVLSEALGMWRGVAFAGLGPEPFAEAEAARLEEVRLACLEERIEADLALGRHAKVVPELDALVTREPFRERFREQLMLALYRSGRQADALAAYRDARHAFSGELGIEPGRALQKLERAILAQEPSLDLPAQPRAAALRRKGGVLVALGAAALLVAALAVATTLDNRGAPKGLAALTPNSIGAIDPATGRIVAQVPIGAAVFRLAASDDAVWALSTTERTLYRIDSSLRELTGSARLDAVVADVAATDDDVWVLHAGKSGAAVVTHYAGDQPAPLRLESVDVGMSLLGAGGASFGVADDRIAVGDDSLWVTTSAERPGGVVALDRHSGRLRFRLGGYVYGLALGADATWLVAEQLLRRVDTEAWQVDLEITLPSPGVAVAAAVGEGAVWALTLPEIYYGAQGPRRTGRGIVTRVDPASEAVSTTIPIGGIPDSIAAGLGSVWITDLDRQMLVRVDPHTNTVVDRIELGARPTSVTLAGGLVWVAVI
jgi:DNA-binding SARP family transcriptional activator/streptogramin lyase